MAHDHDHEHDHEHDDEHDHDHGEHDHGHDAEVEARRRLALAQIRQYGDPALRLTAHEVTDFDDDLRRLVDRMIGLMHDAQGVGLAATQVGVLRRLFVFETDEEGVNARSSTRRSSSVATSSRRTRRAASRCRVCAIPVERPTRVVLEGKDPHGEDVHYELEGYGARVVQHELDHLDGVLIIDRTDDEHRKEALSALRPRVALR